MKRSFSDLMSLVKKPMGYPLLARRESNGHGNGWFHRVHDEDVAAAPTRHVLCETTGECGLVQLGGLEPPTSGSTDRRSNHLSYSCTGIRKRAEIRSNAPAWQGRGARGFVAPARLGVQTKSPGDRPGLRNHSTQRESSGDLLHRLADAGLDRLGG